MILQHYIYMKLRISIVFTLLFSIISIAQVDYLVFNVVVDDNNLHTGEANNSYWIINVSDIDVVKQNYVISPLYLKDHFTNDNLTDCISEKKIDISTHTVNTNFDFDPIYIAELKKIEALLEKRVLLQTIKKKWPNN